MKECNAKTHVDSVAAFHLVLNVHDERCAQREPICESTNKTQSFQQTFSSSLMTKIHFLYGCNNIICQFFFFICILLCLSSFTFCRNGWLERTNASNTFLYGREVPQNIRFSLPLPEKQKRTFCRKCGVFSVANTLDSQIANSFMGAVRICRLHSGKHSTSHSVSRA